MIVLGDPPEAWEALGFTVRQGIVELGEERLMLSGRGGGILEVRARGLTADEPDGLPLREANPQPPSRGSDPVEAWSRVAHPNGATVVDHVVVLTGSMRRTIGALQAAGLDLRRELPGMAFLRLGSALICWHFAADLFC